MVRFKLVFFTPTTHTRAVLATIFAKHPENVGSIGNYREAAFISRGTGQFRPGSGANPTIGTPGILEYVEEDRVEVVVNDNGDNEGIKGAVATLKAAHPYEEVAYDVYRLE
ncbi:hypothetical protein PUNSTDRAFT_23964, partial [Punctularia strigosozonata HHB-11173 SS5]|uniref:uncharacterized protein n=1 Tax=Punctularia strigosozonata (strain HHB-11173) TaxID=741275 RepID=UPI0004416318